MQFCNALGIHSKLLIVVSDILTSTWTSLEIRLSVNHIAIQNAWINVLHLNPQHSQPVPYVII